MKRYFKDQLRNITGPVILYYREMTFTGVDDDGFRCYDADVKQIPYRPGDDNCFKFLESHDLVGIQHGVPHFIKP